MDIRGNLVRYVKTYRTMWPDLSDIPQSSGHCPFWPQAGFAIMKTQEYSPVDGLNPEQNRRSSDQCGNFIHGL